MGIGKRQPLSRKYGKGKQKNTANSGDTKGSRVHVKATASQVRKLLGSDVKKIRLSADGRTTEIIYTATGSHRYKIFNKIRKAGWKDV